MDHGEQLIDALHLLLAPDPTDAQGIGDVFTDGQMREKRQRLEDHAELALMRRHLRNVLAIEHDRTFGRTVETGDHPKQRGLAATRGTEQADEGAVRHGKLDIVDGRERAELLGDGIEGEAGHHVSEVKWCRL